MSKKMVQQCVNLLNIYLKVGWNLVTKYFLEKIFFKCTWIFFQFLLECHRSMHNEECRKRKIYRVWRDHSWKKVRSYHLTAIQHEHGWHCHKQNNKSPLLMVHLSKRLNEVKSLFFYRTDHTRHIILCPNTNINILAVRYQITLSEPTLFDKINDKKQNSHSNERWIIPSGILLLEVFKHFKMIT